MDKNIKRFAGFTLAEVLITLAIIGIVAALTIPSVVANYQKKSFETALKKSYNTLSQAGMQMKLAGVTTNINDTWTANEIVKKLDNYYAFFKIVSKNPETEDGIAYQYYNKTNAGYYDGVGVNLADGSWVSLLPDTGSLLGYGETFLSAMVDTNGIGKKPNRIGLDVFMFSISPNGNVTPYMRGTAWNDNCTVSQLTGNALKRGICFTKFAILNKAPDGSEKTYWEFIK